MGQRPINRWRLWAYKTTATEDTDLATIKPTELGKPRGDQGASSVIDIRDFPTLILRAFGTDANDETFTLRVYGWMDNGPAAKVLDVSGILGAETFTEQFLEVGDVPVSTAFFEADTYTLNDNLVVATVPTASTTRITSHIVLPTLGYKFYQLKILDIGGGAESSSLGVIWREQTSLV